MCYTNRCIIYFTWGQHTAWRWFSPLVKRNEMEYPDWQSTQYENGRGNGHVFGCTFSLQWAYFRFVKDVMFFYDWPSDAGNAIGCKPNVTHQVATRIWYCKVYSKWLTRDNTMWGGVWCLRLLWREMQIVRLASHTCRVSKAATVSWKTTSNGQWQGWGASRYTQKLIFSSLTTLKSRKPLKRGWTATVVCKSLAMHYTNTAWCTGKQWKIAQFDSDSPHCCRVRIVQSYCQVAFMYPINTCFLSHLSLPIKWHLHFTLL